MSIQYGLLDVIPDPNDSITSVNIETFPSPPTTSSFGTTIKTKCRDCSNCCSNTKQTFLDNHHTYPHTTYTAAYYTVAAITVLTLLCTYAYNPTTSLGGPIEQLNCRNWLWNGVESCGLDGARCTPFSSGPTIIRCPPKCAWYDPSLQIWGDNVNGYHGQSKICPAAIHAGVVPTQGGCASVQTIGSSKKYFSSRGGGGLVSKFRNESFFKSFKFTKIKEYNCPGFHHQLLTLGLGYILCVASVLLPASVVRPHLFLLFAQPLLFACFYLRMVDHSSLTNDGPSKMVDAIGTSTSVVLIVAVIYWYTKDQVLTLIDLNAYVKEYNENWNDMDDISDPAGLSNQCCCIGWKIRLQYIFLYVTPCFLGFHIGWFAHIEGLDIVLDSTMFEHDNTQILVVKIVVCLLVFIYGCWVFVHLVKMACKENRHITILGSYAAYAVIIAATTAALLPGFKIHLHHAWVAFVVLFGINFKSLQALMLTGLMGGMLVDGLATYNETWFFNIWQKVPTSYFHSHPSPSPTPPTPRPPVVLPHHFNPMTGNLTSMEIHPTNITVTFPSAHLVHEVFGIGAQSIKLIVNQMIRLKSLHSTAVRNGDCTQDMCTYTLTSLYDGGSYLFQYFVLGSGDRVSYISPQLNVFTPPLPTK